MAALSDDQSSDSPYFTCCRTDPESIKPFPAQRSKIIFPIREVKMEKIRLAEYLQVTLPKSIIELAGLQIHDLLEVSYQEGNIVLRPVKSTAPPPAVSDIIAFAGSCSGAWGQSMDEIAITLAQDHAAWER